MKKTLLLLLFLSVYVISNAQTWQDTVAMIEKIFERYKSANPGCQVAISRNGQVIFSRAWGMADMEHNVPLTTESIIEAGSVSKQFTAAAILLLEQRAKLSLNDDVRKYIPELPDYGMPITLRQMMQHTSGLKDWGSVMALAGWPRSTKTYNNDDALYVISRQHTLNHKPGDEYLYSNSNYNLFAIIVERVSGKTLDEYTRANIFQPAGMKHTEWRNNFKKIVPNRAIAYGKNFGTYYTEMPNEYVYGNGGLLTTAEDLLLWNNYYLSGKLGDPSLLPKQLSITPLNSGRMNYYGAGLRLDSIRGWQVIIHDGATAGYRATLEQYPALGLSVAWLANTSEFDGMPNGTAELRNLLIKNTAPERPYKKLDTVTVAADKLATYVSWYKDIRTGSGLLVFLKEGKLNLNRGGALIPVSSNEFVIGPSKLEFQTGKTKRLLYKTPSDTIVYEAAGDAIVNQQAFQDYIGEYYSDEAEAKLTVSLKEGRLVFHRDPKTDLLVTPTYKDAFDVVNSSVTLFFERDKRNRVTYLKLTTARARNVAFKKL